MQGKLAQLTLVVKDQAASLKFYTEQVGWEKKTDVTPPGGYRWLTVGLAGQDVEIALWQIGSVAQGEQAAWSKEWVPGRAPPIVIRVPDCNATYETLRARGVEFPQPAKQYPWGIAATFRDPDGNLVSLSQPASWAARP